VYLKKYGGGVYWIYLAQDRDKWWALVNDVLNLPIPVLAKISFEGPGGCNEPSGSTKGVGFGECPAFS
jgi:hypothetical protein